MTKKFKIITLIISSVLMIALILGACLYFFVYRRQKQNNEFVQAMKDYYDAKVKEFEKENSELEGTVDVVFLGDSLTDGYDVATYFPQYTTLNRGIGGDTTVGLENRLDVSVYSVKPRVAVMLIGANNMKDMMDNYEDILQGFKENIPDTEIVLISLTSMSREWGKNNQLAAYNNVKIKLLAQKYGYEYVDMYSALLDLTTGEIREEYTTDGGHLTPAGYEVFTRELSPVLEGLLNKNNTD